MRDSLLGRQSDDQDFVVVGATPEVMLAAGFRPVGKDFPVFLHPHTQAEYALARTERKSGRGYHGFTFHTTPDVTLEQDLARRDLTINAMARDVGGHIIDPFNGQADLAAKILRHVGPAFAEDPVRILRLARFAARFADFTVAAETLCLMQGMVQAGEVDHLVGLHGRRLARRAGGPPAFGPEPQAGLRDPASPREGRAMDQTHSPTH